MNSRLWDFAYVADDKIAELANMARPERWDYRSDPSMHNYPILCNYLDHTYRRITQLDRDPVYWCENDSLVCFNTGLFTNNLEPIFAVFVRNYCKAPRKWKLKGFFSESSHELKAIYPLPKKVRYFERIEEVYYNTSLDLRIQYDHVLDDEINRERIPEHFRGLPNLPMMIRTAAEFAKIRIDENYKTAVPQYFKGRIQFLIPISLADPSVVDLALAVNRDGSIYSGRTCLTLDMAYNNARLIARPDADWL